MADNKLLIRVRDVYKTYGQETGNPVKALRGVSLDIRRGEFLAIVGPSGHGKSTLVNCLGAFERPDEESGEITCFDDDGMSFNIWHQEDYYRQNVVGVVFQAFHLLPTLDVMGNVELPLKLHKNHRYTKDRAERYDYVRTALQRFGVEYLIERSPEKLSGGELQRVAIARALIKRPSLILADEPTGNLDESKTKEIFKELRALTCDNIAVLMVTHDVANASDYADRIIQLLDGTLYDDPDSMAVSGGGQSASDDAHERVSSASSAGDDMTMDEHADELDLPTMSDADAPNLSTETCSDSPPQLEKMPPHYRTSPVDDEAGDGEDGEGEPAPTSAPEVAASQGVEEASPRGAVARAWDSLLARLLSSVAPNRSQSLSDLIGYAVRDAKQTSVSLVSNVFAIFLGTLLTVLLLALLAGTKEYIKFEIARTPDIKALYVWADYTASEKPISNSELEDLGRMPDVVAVTPSVQQFVHLFKNPRREAVVSLFSTGTSHPELDRLMVVKGSLEVDPKGWDVVLPMQVAAEIDNVDPTGLVYHRETRGKSRSKQGAGAAEGARAGLDRGRELGDNAGSEVLNDGEAVPSGQTDGYLTLQLRRYNHQAGDENPQPTETHDFPVRVVGIVQSSPDNRVYGSLDMVRFVRDFATGRSRPPYMPAPSGTIDVNRISPRTLNESVRLHYEEAVMAEENFLRLSDGRRRQEEGFRFNVAWAGEKLSWLRDVETVSTIALVGIGLLAIVAGAISIFNTLMASVARKTKEIGILRALGVTSFDIGVIFVAQSVIIGLLACALALVGSIFATHYLNGYVTAHWPELREVLSQIDGLFQLGMQLVAGVVCAVVLICLGAAIFPARSATKKTPMDALRET